MKTIIAATNLSVVSNHAVAFAADVAKALKARLVIFNVVDLAPVMSDAQLPLDAFDATIEQADKLLSDLLEKTKTRTKNEIEIKTLYKIGSVLNELDALCKQEKPLAVFIASPFVNAFERFILGTYSVSIAKYSAFPIIVIPPTATMSGFKKVGLAIDLANDDAPQWQFLRHWLRLFNPEVDIIYIFSDADGSANEAPMAITSEEQLKEFRLNYQFIRNDHVVDGINKYVKKNKPDLLIMYVQKHGIFHKSITKPFIEMPPVPVLFISSKLKADA